MSWVDLKTLKGKNDWSKVSSKILECMASKRVCQRIQSGRLDFLGRLIFYCINSGKSCELLQASSIHGQGKTFRKLSEKIRYQTSKIIYAQLISAVIDNKNVNYQWNLLNRFCFWDVSSISSHFEWKRNETNVIPGFVKRLKWSVIASHCLKSNE